MFVKKSPPLHRADVFRTTPCHLRIPSNPQWIDPAVEFLVGWATHSGVPPKRTARLTVALHEALTNSIIHGNLEVASSLKDQDDGAFTEAVANRCADPAYGHRLVDVVADGDDESVRWVLTDEGPGFDTDAAVRRLEQEGPDPTRPYGRGLALIRAFVDSMRYEAGGRRLHLAVFRAGFEASSAPASGRGRCVGGPGRAAATSAGASS
jgi:anti-sigma regulatory factor (Ser/Thr protein kinase)